MSSTLSVARWEKTGDSDKKRETALLDSRHLTGQVTYLGTHILTLPAAIRARQEGLHREEFLHHEIEQALELDVDQLELHFDADLLYPDVMKMTVKKLRQYRQGLVFSLHLPFRYLDISCPMEKVRSASVETILDAIDLASELEPIHAVIHLTGNTEDILKSGLDPLIGEVMGYVEESLREIVKLMSPEQILVENLTAVDFRYFMPVVERLGLSVCQDVGHIVLQGSDCGKFTRSHAALIREIHLHDIKRRYYSESMQSLIDHQPIGRGTFDFDAFFATLGEIGFQGSIILEIDDQRLMPMSVQYVRNLIQRHLGYSHVVSRFVRDMIHA
ncbi:sugar phosphate isomerase/epimerase [Thermodesulfovibrionales bacterium]|nr:sugar phosphate isomerase/epimerase [Thermodesulfovibrionales bacterium]